MEELLGLAAEEVVDVAALDLLLQGLGAGGAALLVELVEEFVSTFPAASAALRESLAAGAFERAAAEAHRLRSSTGSLAAQSMSAACRRVELAALAGDLARAREGLSALDAAFAAAARALRSYAASAPRGLT
jgi:HPt (histidine-containing phosphotransfer) domain-containing protein